MAKIQPTNTSQPIVGLGTKLDAIGGVCDVIGMTDIPIVSQGAELVSAGISLATGDYIGAALSVGSMIPVVGKAAEAAKVAHKAKRIADGVSAAGKDAKLLKLTAKEADAAADVSVQANAKLLKLTARNSDDVVEVGKQVKQIPQTPTKTQAKSVNKQSAKEIQDNPHHFDSDEYFGFDAPTPAGDSIFANGQPSIKTQTNNFQAYNVNTNSNPAINNTFSTVGNPYVNTITNIPKTPFGI